MQKHNAMLNPLVLALVLCVACMVPMAKAETTANNVISVIPEDPLAAKLRFSSKTVTYKKTYYLRGYSLGWPLWIDEHRYLSEMYAGKGFESKFGEIPPKVVLVDTRTGKVEEAGLEGKLRCYSEGRIATYIQDSHGLTDYLGKLGEPLHAYPDGFPKNLLLNVESCQLVPRWPFQPREPGKPYLVERFPLKVEHGTIFEWQPASFPELRLGQDEHNRPGFYRTGPEAMPPLQVYWEQPSGKRIDIPFNPGEKIRFVSYIPFEKAYLIEVDLTGTQPIATWAPHFMRLLYPDGTVKRFGVPSIILDFVRARKGQGLYKYTKRGMDWGVGFNSREPDKQHLGGFYEVHGDELVKIEASVGLPGPDGCREYGWEKQFFSALKDFYYIDVCKGE